MYKRKEISGLIIQCDGEAEERGEGRGERGRRLRRGGDV